jgi:AcrR family transcriptional regulator
MEDIASEAGLSRAALYLQFRSKEDIFRDLAGGLHDEALAQAQSALRSGVPLTERLRAAVEAKTLRMIEIAYASPHGSELMDETNRLCGDLASDSARRFQEMLTRVFSGANRSGEIQLADAGLSAAEAAELFIRATYGLKGPDVSPDQFRKRLSSLTRVFVAGLSG